MSKNTTEDLLAALALTTREQAPTPSFNPFDLVSTQGDRIKTWVKSIA